MAKKKKLKTHILYALRNHYREMLIHDLDEWMCSYNQYFGLYRPYTLIARVKSNSKRKKNSLKEEKDYIACDFIGFPTIDQETQFYKTFGCRRFVWNHMKADRDKAYDEKGEVIKPTPDQYKKDYPWLKEVDSTALANTQQDLEKAYDEYIKGERGKPKFKKKLRCKESYTSVVSNKKNPNIRLEGDLLTLPKCKDPVRLKVHREISPGGTLKRCTVYHAPTGEWHFILVFEYRANEPRFSDPVEEFLKTGDPECLKHLDLDMSLPKMFISSDGTLPEYINNGIIVPFSKHYRKLEKKIAKAQKKLSRMKEGSSNYKKQCRKIARLHAKAKHQRQDFLHQLSIRLVREYDVISIEDLDLAAMKKALRFGKSISDNGWGMFVQMLQYKGGEAWYPDR